MSDALADPWSRLSDVGAARRGEFRVTEAGVASAEGGSLYALDHKGLRHLLIPIRLGVPVEADERSSGVHIVGRTLEDGRGEANFVDVACLKPHLGEVFGHLAQEVLEGLSADPGRPAAAARRALNRWRELLERERTGILTQSEMIGLFGELLILERLSRRNPEAVRIWMGPTGARFDFQRGPLGVEVKTTTSLQQRLVRIHGVDQLDVPPGSELHLAVVSVEVVNNAGESIPDVVARIRSQGVDALEFSSRLGSAGYSDHDAPYYARIRFAVRAEAVYKVDPDFPRITRASLVGGNLPAGVTDLQYTVDLTSPPPAPLSSEQAQQLWAVLAE